MAKITQSFQYGSHTVTLETGEIARQASGACLASMGDTVVLVTVVAQREPMPGKGFLPDDGRLSGNAPTPRDAFPAASSNAKAGRPRREILTSRLIDRPIRPLFPEGFTLKSRLLPP